MVDDCFFHLNNFPLLDKKYLQEAMEGDYSDNPNQSPYLDEKMRVPESLHAYTSFSKSQFCSDLASHFGIQVADDFETGYSEHIKASYLKVLPYHGIDWHHDISRNCAINVLLNDVNDGITLFRNKNKNNRVLQENWALKYELFRPVLLNTTVEHMVANWSSHPRYLLTIGLPKRVSFHEVKEFLKTYVPPKQL